MTVQTLPPALHGTINSFQSHRSRITRSAQVRAVGLWDGVDKRNILESWQPRAAEVARITTLAQAEAATAALQYTDAALSIRDGVRPPQLERIDPAALAGYSYPLNGNTLRDLEAQMLSPAFTTIESLHGGVPEIHALQRGRGMVQTHVHAAVTDAARQAAGMAMQVTASSRKTKIWWIRQISPGACARCVILAGKHFWNNDGFERHPNCNCFHVPLGEHTDGAPEVDQYAYFESLSEEEQSRIFTNAGAQAIRDGADMNQIVNARRGMSRAGSPTTTEGTTRKGYWGYKQRAFHPKTGRALNARLTPEGIYSQNISDERKIELLIINGYILPQGQVPGGAIRGNIAGFLKYYRDELANPYAIWRRNQS